jgi:hypothetical protein
MRKNTFKTKLVLRRHTLRTLIEGELPGVAAGQADVNATAPPFSIRDQTCVVAAVTVDAK